MGVLPIFRPNMAFSNGFIGKIPIKRTDFHASLTSFNAPVVAGFHNADKRANAMKRSNDLHTAFSYLPHMNYSI